MAATDDEAGLSATRRRLLLAQGMLERGEALCKTGDPLDCTLALLILHCAVETVMRALAIELRIVGVNGLRQLTLTELVSLIEKDAQFVARGTGLFRMDLVRQLNEKRNAAQHTAEPVHAEVLEECRATARSFLLRVFADFFNARLGELSQLDFVASAGVRRLLKMGRELNQRGDEESVALAVTAAKLALALALDSWFKPKRSMLLPALGSGAIGAVIEFERMVAMLSTSVNFLEFQRIESMGHAISRYSGGRIALQRINFGANGIVDDFAAAEAFAIDAVLKWQRAGYEVNVAEDDHAVKHFAEIASLRATPAASPAIEVNS